MSLLGGGEINSVSNIRRSGDTTSFTWTVGRWRKRKFGDGITTSTLIPAGADEWKLTFYPWGFTDPDFTSLYVTNNNCELDEGDPLDKTRITSSALASVKVTFKTSQTKKEPKDAKKGDEGGSGKSQAGSRVSGTSKATSTSKGGSSKATSRASGGTNKCDKGSTGAGGKEKATVEIVRTLSAQFTNLESSWGWEEYLELDKLYSTKSGYVQDVPGNEVSNIPDGKIQMEVEILAVTGIDVEQPQNDREITAIGRMRTRWTIRDFKTLREKVRTGQKISSGPFGRYFFVLYPRGYRIQENDSAEESKQAQKGDGSEWVSIYLHTTRAEVERGDTRKQTFRLGFQKARRDFIALSKPTKVENESVYYGEGADARKDEVFFPYGSQVTATFNQKDKCFGKQKLVQFDNKGQATLYGSAADKRMAENPPLDDTNAKTKPDLKSKKPIPPPRFKCSELIAGDFNKGGAITIVLDMAVTDEYTGALQHMLHVSKDASFFQDSPSSGFFLAGLFGGSKSTSFCYWCGKLVPAADLRVDESSRFPDWGLEIGKEFIMDRLMREEESLVYQATSKVHVDQKLNAAWNFLLAESLRYTILAGQKTADEDDEEKALTGQRKRLLKKEQDKQAKFQKALEELRQKMETAYFAKPVCSECNEASKEYDSARRDRGRSVAAMVPPVLSDKEKEKRHLEKKKKEEEKAKKEGEQKRKQEDQDKKKQAESDKKGKNKIKEKGGKDDKGEDEKGKEVVEEKVAEGSEELQMYFAWDWKEAKEDLAKRYGKLCEKMDSVDLRAENQKEAAEEDEIKIDGEAMTIVHGGLYVEPLELTRQCPGRIHEHDPQTEDETAPRDGFCDVRFDRRYGRSFTPPDKHHCNSSGKVFCQKCCRWQAPMLELQKDPSSGARMMRMCFTEKERRAKAEAGRIQPVSNKPKAEESNKRKMTNQGGEEQAIPQEEEDEDENPVIGAIRKYVPWCGAAIADKGSEWINPEG